MRDTDRVPGLTSEQVLVKQGSCRQILRSSHKFLIINSTDRLDKQTRHRGVRVFRPHTLGRPEYDRVRRE